MRIVDLTLPINRHMTGIPLLKEYVNPARCVVLTTFGPAHRAALEARGIEVLPEARTDHSTMSRIEIITHAGTHVDAPAHFLEGAKTIDEVGLERIVKRGRVIPLTHVPAGGEVDAETILATGVDFDATVIPVLHTGWTDRAWGTPRFWDEMIYLHPSVGDLMVERGVTAVAIDCFPEIPFWRFKPEPHQRGYNHRRLLGNNTIIIQMLANIGKIDADDFTLVAAPLLLEGIDGSPARVFAIVA